MAESLALPDSTDRETVYASLLPQLDALLAAETDFTANMANTAAVLKTAFDWLWVGFYRVHGGELILGPFQGPLACTRIAKGRGVCGTAWAEDATQRVADVAAFPGHIACSSEARAEIVVPVRHDGAIVAVLDIDSRLLDDFSIIDETYLRQVTELLIAHSDLSLQAD